MIDSNAELSLRRQCELLQINRSTIYYKAAEIDMALQQNLWVDGGSSSLPSW